MRMNNRKARDTVNKWLDRTGRPVPGEELSYEGYAAKLLQILKPGTTDRFVTRAEAVEFIRSVALSL